MKNQIKLKLLPALTILIVLFIASAFTIKISQSDQVTTDLAVANSNIHWPKGMSPKTADLFAHNEIIIDAPVNVVFRHLQEATKWPQWYPNAQNVVLKNDSDGLLKSGTEWTWETFGVKFTSKISEYVKNSRIGWFGYGDGWKGCHTWYLVPVGKNKTHVITEECVYGEGAKKMRSTNAASMHNGHDLWDKSLKKLAEGK